jgi:hypothetical protein
MIFGFFTLFVALVISAVAAYYSIVGLTAIFSAAVIPIIIMGAALEVGKVTAAVWLKMNWARANFTYKLYLVPAVAFLMLLTSMGIFGFLSKAHSDQNLVGGDVQAKIAVYDEKIRTAKENIDVNRRALKQMDEAVDQIMGRSTTETGADKAVAVRRNQQKERGRLLAEIEAEQKKISIISEERAPIAAEVRKVEAEVGPIKYIAALIYDENTDEGMLEKAVRFVIIIIVAVFDPLALVLILAAQQSLRWHREDQEAKEKEEGNSPLSPSENLSATVTEQEPAYEPDDGPLTDDQLEQIRTLLEKFPNGIPEEEPIMETPVAEQSIFERHPYLNKEFAHFQNLTPMVYKPQEPVAQTESEPAVEEIVQVTVPVYRLIGNGYVEVEGKMVHSRVLLDLYPEVAADIVRRKLNTESELNLAPRADNEPLPANPSSATFGVEFPQNPTKGEMFLQISTLPSKLFKFNGNRWISIDKSITDLYTYNEEYLQYIIDSIDKGLIGLDDLTVGEQEQITQYLKKNA